VREWNVSDGRLERTIRGHRDTIYALALSPDGSLLATGSYDQKIKLWRVADGSEARTLSGHNGAVFGLAFRPDGRLLASASADRTVKLWDVTTGERRDTLSQPLKEQVGVAWSPDGKRLAAGGGDHRLRIWNVSPEGNETTNPLAIARYAHEQPIIRVAWSRDGDSVLSSAQDGTVKLWSAAEMKERLVLPKQPDWPTAIADAGDVIVAGFGNGQLLFFKSATGEAVAPITGAEHCCDDDAVELVAVTMDYRDACEHDGSAEGIFCQAAAKEDKKTPAKPELARLLPAGVQRGSSSEVVIVGKNLPTVVSARSSDPKVAVFTAPGDADRVPLLVQPAADLVRGTYEIALLGGDGKEIGRLPLRVTDHAARDIAAAERGGEVTLPVTIWSGLDKAGEVDRYQFGARAGQMLVIDAGSKTLGGKADVVLELVNATGAVLASSNNFNGEDAPFIAHRIPVDGTYAVLVKDLQMTGGPDHRYSLTMGELPWVVAAFPPALAANQETEVELIGYNLPPAPASRRVKVKAAAAGQMPLPLDAQRFFSRGSIPLTVTDLPTVIEEPRASERGQTVAVPISISGRLSSPGERDLFRFAAKRGRVYAIETEAARRGSPADTRIAVLSAEGMPVPRMLFEAVRDSAITFRPIDSASPDVRVENWREMELNEWMWTGGEINKIFRMPEGPDSGFQYYANAGKRIAYFNTSPTAHALDESCYIVEPHPPGTTLAANGLPRFVLNYESDDDGERELGTDSRLLFTAPEDGEYLVRVEESQGLGGEHFTYRLVIRDARQDFAVKVAEYDGTVNAGSGTSFSLVADRVDGFDGDIRCDIRGVPAGWHVTTPLVIQAGHLRAKGSLNALPGAKQPTADEWKAVTITARAKVAGADVEYPVSAPGLPKLGPAPQLYVGLVPPAAGSHEPASGWAAFDPEKPFEFAIAPGEIIPAWLVVKRAGAKGALRFEVENLPHGVIVDNLGLNGITLLEDQEQGEIFLKAAPWVKEQECLAHAVCRDAGKQASLPFILRVKQKAEKSKIVNVK
jgi:hypothetical protein